MLRAGVLVLLAAAACAVQAQQARTPRPVIEAARGGQCVAEPAVMRRTHMDLLQHQRDRTVRVGDRASPYSLKACIECHASVQTQSVARTGTNFCMSCHTYAAVKIDCFDCHASTPKGQVAGAAR